MVIVGFSMLLHSSIDEQEQRAIAVLAIAPVVLTERSQKHQHDARADARPADDEGKPIPCIREIACCAPNPQICAHEREGKTDEPDDKSFHRPPPLVVLV